MHEIYTIAAHLKCCASLLIKPTTVNLNSNLCNDQHNDNPFQYGRMLVVRRIHQDAVQILENL
jgi:hypothetical protein